MKCSRDGSVLILALVAVSVAVMLVAGAATVLRAGAATVESARRDAATRRIAMASLDDFISAVITPDTNGFDCLSERWCGEWPDDSAGAVFDGTQGDYPERARLMREFPDVDVSPCIDEDSRLPINQASEAAISALLHICGGMFVHDADSAASDIAGLRPFPQREFLKRSRKISDDVFNAIAPYISTAPIETVNVNTASKPVLEALFSAAQNGTASSGTASSLTRKLMNLREHGGFLKSLDEAEIANAIGGLSLSEIATLRALSGKIAVESRFFSGAMYCDRTVLIFTFDRKENRFLRTIFANQR